MQTFTYLRLIRRALNRIRASEPSAPSFEEAARAIRGISDVRAWRRGELKFKRTPTRGNEPAQFLRAELDWLAGRTGGNLTGPIMRAFMNRELQDRMQTLAILIRMLEGKTRTPALEAWKRTGVI